MTSQRPYLLRALHEWIIDNGMTPHIVADAMRPGVTVPPSAIRDGQVVLNISDSATGNLRMDDDMVAFNARFGGVNYAVFVPVDAVLAIYARETGMGMALPPDPVGSSADDEPDVDQPGVDDAAPIAGEPAGRPRPALQPVASSDDAESVSRSDDDPPTSPPPKRGGHLKVVK